MRHASQGFLVPVPSGTHDSEQIGFPGPPSQQGLAKLWVGNQRRRIAWPARTLADRNAPAADRFDGRNHIADRVTTTGPQIDAGARSFCEKMIERFDVSAREIADVHIIAHGRAVGRVVIGSKELKKWNLSLRRRDDERDEVGLGCVVLSDLPIGIGPGSIEVAQIHVPQAVSPLVPIQDVFHEQFRGTIGIDRP